MRRIAISFFKRRRRAAAAGTRRTRRRRVRLLTIAAACVLVVTLVAGILFMVAYVEVTSRFEGRLWTLPSRIYSDALELSAGDPYGARALVERLQRSGYAPTTEAPRRPGEYRQRSPGTVETFTRSFESGGRSVQGQAVLLRFSGGRLAAVSDARGRPVAAVFEPELLASVFGPHQEDRLVVQLAEVPQPLVQSVLAIEDARYFSHHGVDVRGIMRAAWANLREGRVLQGGSTITQQAVKNLFLGQQRTWWRKSREGVMSLVLEARYSKERILEVYLNEVYLGQRGSVAVCGMGAAARFYFGRDLAELNLGESALLAGLIQSPGRYNPFANPQRAVERRNTVLDVMLRLGWIEPAQAEAARAQPLRLASGGGGFTSAPWIADLVRAQLAEHFSADTLQGEGLQVLTTIDTRWQAAAAAALESGVQRLERDVGRVRRQRKERTLEGAVVVTDPATGAVLALIGGRDHARSQFNRAVQARRQPGSCFKPFVYGAGFEQALAGEGGLTVASLLDDSPIEMISAGKLWAPENYDGQFRGPVRVRQALQESLNVPAVRASERVGLTAAIDLARRCGITSPLAAVPALALGSEVVTPLELATAYGTLANAGVRHAPWVIREVRDRQGALIGRRTEEAGQPVVDPRAVYLLNDVLAGVFDSGTAGSSRELGYHGHAAGKTGTTDDTRDAWFVGYTPELLALVWVGYDDNAQTGLTGASGALPIWIGLLERAGFHENSTFAEPPGMLRVEIDPETEGLATPACLQVVEEVFAFGTEPVEPCVVHGEGGLWRRLRRWFGGDAPEEEEIPPGI